jgi:hypothetical protein
VVSFSGILVFSLLDSLVFVLTYSIMFMERNGQDVFLTFSYLI